MFRFFKNSSVSLFFAVIFCIFLTECNTTPSNNSNNQNNRLKNSAMSIYAASVTSLKLPFRDTCDDTVSIQKLHLADSLLKFKKYGELVGKISETKQYTAILYAIPADVQLPVLHTFNNDGKEISALKLFIGNCCGENEGCSGLSTVQITKDLHIILKDSMQTFERDKKRYDKKRSIKILKKREEFKIDSTGKILPIIPLEN